MLAALLVAAQEVNVKAKNPIIPEGKEIVWAVIAFTIVFVVLAWKAWPAIKKALKDREDRIRGDLERAEQARVEAETSLDEYRRQLAEARTEANAIIEQARESADEVRRELIARAETDAAELRQRAAEDIRLASERAMSELHGKVAELSIELAEKVIEQNLDRDAQTRLIENYINQVGARNGG
jgi:F-type H+-transporting ATPase subunit b